MPKVSVIVPIFGVEKYIERCTVSLMEQTLDDMEFIFVNDCTKDNSIGVLQQTIERYPERKPQIKIINKECNEGASYARKTGIGCASGEYIGFCDSDDWVDKSMYEKLYSKAIKNGLDYVKCGRYVSDGSQILTEEKVSFSEIPDKKEVMSKLLCCRGGDSVWDTISRKSIYLEHQFVFTQNAMLEDFLLAVQILEYCNTYGIVQEPLYYYFQNPDSVCNVPSTEAFIKRGKQAEANVKWILDFIHNRYGNKYEKYEVILKYVPRRLIIPIMKDPVNYSSWNSISSGGIIDYLLSPYATRTLKLQRLLVELHLYSFYKKIQ